MISRKSLSGKSNPGSETQGSPIRLQDRPAQKYVLKLYISGMTPRSKLAIDNIRNICQDYLSGRCELDIIDIFEHPAVARNAQVIAVPTLVKESPLPLHRIIGDLSQTEKVLSGLDLRI